MSWQVVQLGTLCDVYDGPHGTPAKIETGPWYLSISSLRGGRLNLSESAHLSWEDFPRWTKRVRPLPGDTLFSYETRLGESAYWELEVPAALGRRMGLLRPKPGVDPRFLSLAYQSPQFQGEIARRAVQGATVDRIPIGEMATWPIAVPPLDEQRRIAQVLGALDDLINTNERLANAQTSLAKSHGQRLLSHVSEGEVGTIEDIATIAKGYSYKSAELVEGGGWLVGLKNVGRRGEFRSDGFKPLNAEVKPSQVVDNGDIVVAHTDLTQAREVIGRPVRVRRGKRVGTLVASLDLAVVRPKPGVSVEYLQAVLESSAFREHALGYCNGTTVLHMSSQALPSFPVAVPGEDYMRAFDELAVLRAGADDAYDAADELRRTRDQLLPLLMSGAVRVRPEGVAA